MSTVTDALIVVDPKKILADHGTNNGYVPLKDEGLGYIFIVATWQDVAHHTRQSDVSEQQAKDHQEEEGGDKLKLILHVGDVARFRSQSLGWLSDYQCFIDKILINSTEKHITAFNSVCPVVSTTELDPMVTPFSQYAPTSSYDYWLESTTLLSGKVPYTVQFSIYDAKAQRQGGFTFESELWVVDAFGATQVITAPSLTTSTLSVSKGAKVDFDYATPPSKLSSQNWVGLYLPNTHPGYGNAASWQYAPNVSDTVTFDTTNLAPATYSAWYCYNGNVTTLAGPIALTVTNP